MMELDWKECVGISTLIIIIRCYIKMQSLQLQVNNFSTKTAHFPYFCSNSVELASLMTCIILNYYYCYKTHTYVCRYLVINNDKINRLDCELELRVLAIIVLDRRHWNKL